MNLPCTNITVALITYNEEANLPFALENIKDFAQDIIVLDSGSKDSTVDIAKNYGARVFYRDFDDFSSQRKYLLNEIDYKTEWVFVLDADEYLTEDLKSEIIQGLDGFEHDAYFINRRFYWQGAWIKRGYYPTNLLRFGRVGKINCDSRPINEHLICNTSNIGQLKYDFIDQNRKSISDWVDKHNNYSTREALALVQDDDTQYRLFKNQYETKRWVRKNIWERIPPFVRPTAYLVYRLVIKMGILDGRKACLYHFLHAFWYRALIDAKYLELKWKNIDNETNTSKY